ncbi:MAG TPA: hypothetical protein VK893_11820, partial [Pyrinomonadaceae bacterium]|nr:hypothetical protein [Pyrinomonadaceae bacterium]
MNRMTVAVLGTFVVILLGSGFLAYVFRDQPGTAVTGTATPSASPGSQIAAPGASEKEAERGVPLLSELFGGHDTGVAPANLGSWESTSAQIALRFALAAFLAALLAFRPRRGSVVRRN